MGDFPHYFDIILFAMIAAFLVLRLRSVLGRRTGNERRQAPMVRSPQTASDKAVPLGGQRIVPPPPSTSTPPDTVKAGLGRIKEADPEFEPGHFLEGARGAFEIIVSAFAAGDKPRLRPLLSDEVYGPFAAAIDERKAAGETLETRILRTLRQDIAEADMVGHNARITLKLVSEQLHVLRAHDGSVVDGDPNTPLEKTDFWSFERDTRSRDPNWLLVATDSG